jgi:hypothetical protein
MTMQVADLVPGLPPLSILTVIGFSLMIAMLVLYMLSRIPELLLIAVIACVYGMVPLISMVKHC